MDDTDFFDELYQLWSQTSWAGDSYWMPEEYQDGTGRFKVYAVDCAEHEKKLIASELADADAEFIAGLHSALPDLVRLLHELNDRAERAEYGKDSREAAIFDLECELSKLRKELE